MHDQNHHDQNRHDQNHHDAETRTPGPGVRRQVPHRQRSKPHARVGSLGSGALVLACTALALALALEFGPAAAATSSPSSAGCSTGAPHLRVQGSGQTSGTPDELTAVFGFASTAGDSAAALTQNNTTVDKALLALAAHGVAKADMATTALSLSPQYVYPHGVPTLTGYQATETLSVTLRDLSRAGAAIDAVVGATGNAATIDSLRFSFRNPATVQDRARTMAVHQAVAHAEAMAAAAGRALGPVCSLTDDTQPSTPVVPQGTTGFAAPAARVPSVPTTPGTQVVSDQVTIVYALVGRGAGR